MTSWRDVSAAVPDLATKVQARFESNGVAVLATLRSDGGPRTSGIEPSFMDGEVWIGGMPGARKSADLRADPRLSLFHNVDKDVSDGDARISGRAVEVGGPEKDRFVERFVDERGNPMPPGPFDLFRIDVAELLFLQPEGGDHLLIEWWTPGGGYRSVERR